jgi:hypothetical protein
VPDCYLGLLLRADDPDQARGVLVVSPAAFLHPGVGQPDGTLVYELVFLADLTVELRTWPHRHMGPRSGSTRRRPPARWWQDGGAATCSACGGAG